MKNNQPFILLVLLAILVSSCRKDTSVAPLEFKGYENNPILVPGEPGSFDDYATMMPYVFRVDDVYYMFYEGWSKGRQGSIGMATSPDGYHFTKFTGNPVFPPRASGFDSYATGSPVVLKEDTLWVLYYNGGETALYVPAPNVGRATARELTGPWERMDAPVLTRGSMSEWDGGFILLTSVVKLDNGSFILYYSAGVEFSAYQDFSIGLATSTDGIHWVKYNDPSTTEHPFADSDPVMKGSFNKKQDDMLAWKCRVYRTSFGFEMYFSENYTIAYATSPDGIHWEKYKKNRTGMIIQDTFAARNPNDIEIEFPTLLRLDSINFVYYDYGTVLGSIGVAVCPVSGQRSAGTNRSTKIDTQQSTIEKSEHFHLIYFTSPVVIRLQRNLYE